MRTLNFEPYSSKWVPYSLTERDICFRLDWDQHRNGEFSGRPRNRGDGAASSQDGGVALVEFNVGQSRPRETLRPRCHLFQCIAVGHSDCGHRVPADGRQVGDGHFGGDWSWRSFSRRDDRNASRRNTLQNSTNVLSLGEFWKISYKSPLMKAEIALKVHYTYFERCLSAEWRSSHNKTALCRLWCCNYRDFASVSLARRGRGASRRRDWRPRQPGRPQRRRHTFTQLATSGKLWWRKLAHPGRTLTCWFGTGAWYMYFKSISLNCSVPIHSIKYSNLTSDEMLFSKADVDSTAVTLWKVLYILKIARSVSRANSESARFVQTISWTMLHSLCTKNFGCRTFLLQQNSGRIRSQIII